jgi:hypothetical protein
MASYIEYEADWAYYIDPKTFDMPKVTRKVPVGAVVLTKGRETLDTGITVVITKYGIARSDGVADLGGKREASEELTRQMLDYMRSKKEFPPGVDEKKRYSNGNVDLEFAASANDKFTIKLNPKVVGGNVADLLDTLATPSRRKFNPTENWRIERAKSSRATCRTCGTSIDKDTVRVGEPSYYQDHLSWKWHHLKCVSDEVWGIPKEKLEGYDSLDDEGKSLVQSALWD